MKRHKEFTIDICDMTGSFFAVHDSYDPTPYHSDDSWGDDQHPVFYGEDVLDCVEQINEWYEENV